jgi:hypothetical protein
METVNVPVSTLETLIEGLESAIKVSYTALDAPTEQGYPYATGYSRAAMREVCEQLKTLISHSK